MQFRGVPFRPRSILRVLRAISDSRGLSSKLTVLRCIHGWASTKLGRTPVAHEETIDFGQFKLAVDTSRAEIIPYLEIWREHCYDLLPEFGLRSADCIVDVGANIGLFSLYQALQKKAKLIFAFEPAPSVFRRLKKNIVLNGITSVRTINAAVVGDPGKSVPFREFPMSINSRIGLSTDPGTVMIPSVTLDCALADVSKIDILKVDAEGYESRVLMGATETLKKTDRIVIEAVTQADREDVASILLPSFRCVATDGDVLYYSRIFKRESSPLIAAKTARN
jgi:FkbM family methyltransferase